MRGSEGCAKPSARCRVRYYRKDCRQTLQTVVARKCYLLVSGSLEGEMGVREPAMEFNFLHT
jgi:hypothetical protein